MTLISWNGTGPILKSGAIGTEQACCCGGIKFCTCSAPAPSSVSMQITLGTLVSTFGTPDPSCDKASVEAKVNKTYVLSQDAPTALSWSYSDGETNVLFSLGCPGVDGFLQISWAASTWQPCWNRYDLFAPYDDTASSVSLCDIATTNWVQSGDVFIYLNLGTLVWSQQWTLTAEAAAL